MTETEHKVLIIEDDPGLRSQMKWSLDKYTVFTAGDRPSALIEFRREAPAVVILDLGLPPDAHGPSEGLTTLSAILAENPATKVIIATGNEDRANALQAIALGAYDFHHKPMDADVMRLLVERAFTLFELEEENRQLAAAQELEPQEGIIAGAPNMLQLCRSIERVAHANVAVLITGESGTGKEVFTSAIHRASPRADKPFVAINCAAIPEHLLESELFGHEKGSFTGAIKQSIGKVEQAHTGTLFLDEIGDMPLPLQAKLLRFLQNRVIERIGGRKEIPVDVRILSATNRDLAEAIAEGRFREDLYYRLNEVSLHIPPLRERPGDAVLLARFFLKKHANSIGRAPKGFAPDALAAISTYHWPGNVRELENRVRRSMLMAEGKLITSGDLELPMDGLTPSFPPLRKIREMAENDAVGQALALAKNNISNAAHILGVSRPTVYTLMRRANLKGKD